MDGNVSRTAAACGLGRVGGRRGSGPASRALRRHGIGLVELLLALSISAALLTATGVAIDASFKSYAVNQEISDLGHRSRLALHRITSLVRQTREHAPVSSSVAAEFATGKTVSDSGIQMFDASNHHTTFRYDADARRVVAVVNGVEHPLVEGVEAFSVTLEPMRSATAIRTGGGWDLLRRATILITLRSDSGTALKGEGTGRQAVTLSASVMPRRNTW